MKLVKNISLIFIILVAIGCTKPENDAPGDVVPRSVTDEPFRFDYDEERESFDLDEPASPVFINDDEDDETGPTDQRK